MSKITLGDGVEWLEGYVDRAQLVLTDPPHLDTFPSPAEHAAFVKSWVKPALEALRPGGVLYHTCGESPDELRNYLWYGATPTQIRVWPHGLGHHYHLVYHDWVGPTVVEDEKPFPLYPNIIALVTEPGQLVLDPFCGRGEIPEAAKFTERAWAGCEIVYDSVYACHEAGL